MTGLPLVSILINNYNYARYLGQAIDSALQQSYPHVEVVVVDDGSSDGSGTVIAGYGERVRPILKQNAGQASAFNAGFAASQGELICFLDSDDWFLPDKVERVVAALGDDMELGWCFHALRLVEEGQTRAEPRVLPRLASGRYDVRQGLRGGRIPLPAPATSGICFRRALLAQILPMPTGASVSISDRYLKLAAQALAPGCFLEQPLAALRIHSDNIYSLRANNAQLKAQILILTAYWLRERFPELRKLANRLLANGLSLARRAPALGDDAATAARRFLATSSPLERLMIRLGSSYFSYRPRRGRRGLGGEQEL